MPSNDKILAVGREPHADASASRVRVQTDGSVVRAGIGGAWSLPYYGVTHLDTPRHLCTVVDYGFFAIAFVYRKPVRLADGEQREFDGAAEARLWCQMVAQS